MVSIKNDLKALCPECGNDMTKGDLVERECIRCGNRFVDDEICINGHYVCELENGEAVFKERAQAADSAD